MTYKVCVATTSAGPSTGSVPPLPSTPSPPEKTKKKKGKGKRRQVEEDEDGKLQLTSKRQALEKTN